MHKSKIILLSTLAVLSLTACNKSETESLSSSDLTRATPTPVATSTPTPQPTSIPDNHDFDLYIDQFKDEYSTEHGIDLEITSDDDGTDIPNKIDDGLTVLHDWLYSNGVDRASVESDKSSGCKNPYLDGYLEYLDNLDNSSENTSNTGFGPGAHVKLEGATKTTYPGTDVEALEKDGVYYTVFSDGTTDGSYYVIDNEGNLSVELPWMGELQQQPDDDATDKVKEAMENNEYADILDKYSGI